MATNRSLRLLAAAIMLLIGACSTPAPNDVAATPAPDNAPEATQAPQSDATQSGRRERRRIDFAAAAQKLGVTETQLREALGRSPQPAPATDETGRPARRRLDIEGAAAKLGVTEAQLREALGRRPRGDRQNQTDNGQS